MAKKPLKKINDKDAPTKVELVAPAGTYATIEVEDKVCFLKKPSRQTYAKVIPMLTPMMGGEVNIPYLQLQLLHTFLQVPLTLL